jgi:SNF2 family DNA or RNA helicase/uncharacterized Zn finger protein
MSYVNFGNTWWGAKWLDALTHIDFENRLPRGKSYARNGSVRAVAVNDNSVAARVQGHRPRPYAVSIVIPEFSKSIQRRILKTVLNDRLFLSQLMVRKLPRELYQALERKKIKLFPERWRDLRAECSCPDWAVPCKHIAAVIYLVANEIDKNPFLVFSLHGFDILGALEKQGYAREHTLHTRIVSLDDLFARDSQKLSSSSPLAQESYNRVDFSTVPLLYEQIFTLLVPKPVFYPEGDFKSILEGVYKTAAKILRFSAEEEPSAFERDTEEYVNVSLILGRDLHPKACTLLTADGKFSIDAGKDFSALCRFLQSIPSANLSHHSDPVIALWYLYRFALRMVEQGAYVPQLIQIAKNSYRIRWVPALLNKEVKKIFLELCGPLPPKLIAIDRRRSSLRDIAYPGAHEQALLAVSLFLQHFVGSSSLNANARDEKTRRIFLLGDVLVQDSFESQELPHAINLWLGKFFIAHKRYTPLLKVEPKEECFIVNGYAADTKEILREPIPIARLLQDESYKDYRSDVMRDLVLLAEQFPELEEMIRSEGDKSLSFSPKAFGEIFFKVLPTIKLLGIEVLLPKALQEMVMPKLTLAAAKGKAGVAKTYLSLGQMLEFDWRIALGDTCVTKEEFAKMVKTSEGIIKFKDQYVYFDQNEMRKIFESLKRGAPRFSPQESFKTMLLGEYNGAPIELGADIIKTRDDFLALKEVPLPRGFTPNLLRPYQERGYRWLYKNAKAGLGSLLADDMGLGKTIQVLAVCLKLKEEGAFKTRPGLVIVPTTLLTNWQREIERFAPLLKTHLYHGASRKFGAKGYDLVLTTYGTVRRETARFGASAWSLLVMDEAQNIKNALTAQTAAVKSLAASVKIAMTGTPVENRLSEYWSIVDVINRGYFGPLKRFVEDFALPIELYRDNRAIARFRNVTAPFILRRVKTDKTIIKDLPEKNEIDQFCALTKEQASLYHAVVDSMLRRIETSEGIERRGRIFKLMTALKQICNHPAHYLKKRAAPPEASGKTALLLEILGTIYANDEKVLLFTQYTEMGKLLVTLLEEQFKSETLFLHGGVARKKRDELVDRFQNERQLNTLVLSLKAGGTGLNLTAATHVVHFDRWWNPAVEAQATDRAYRIGQTKNVMVYRMITKDTFEEKINEMILNKKELADISVVQGEKWIGELSNKELRSLFTLRG